MVSFPKLPMTCGLLLDYHPGKYPNNFHWTHIMVGPGILIASMRQRLLQHPSYRFSITPRDVLGASGANFAIDANSLSPDLSKLTDYSMQLLTKAQALPSITDVRITLAVPTPEIHVAVDPRRAAICSTHRHHREHATSRRVGRR